MDWQVICTLIGTVLGGQGIIELVKWYRNRNVESRIAETHADSEEFSTISQTNLFLQQQLQEKEERFAKQTDLVRSLNAEVIQLTKEKAEIELTLERYKAEMELELERVRCSDLTCPWRRPPNAYTAPKPGTDKDEYHKQKEDESN